LKKLKKLNQKALTSMKQKLLKHNKEYENEIANYIKNPIESDAEDEHKQESPTKEEKKQKQENKYDDDDDDEEEWKQVDDDDDDDEVDFNDKNMYDRKFWEKTAKDYERERAEKANADNKDKNKDALIEEKKRMQEKRRAAAEERERQKEAAQAAGAKRVEVELTPEMINKKLKEILASRGRRGTDRKQVIDDLRLLASKSRTSLTLLKVQIALCSALFETSLNRGTHMQIDHWKAAVDELNAIISSLNSNPQIRLSEDEEVEEKDDDDNEDIEKVIGSFISAPNSSNTTNPNEDKKEGKNTNKKKPQHEEDEQGEDEDGNKVEYVIGNLYSFIHRISTEYTNSLRHIDHHTPDYLNRLKDETDLIKLIARAQEYYIKIKKEQFLTRVILRRMELTYYHYSSDLDVQNKGEEKKYNDKKIRKWDNVALDELAEYLYRHGAGRDRTRALLYHVYYLSIHNRFMEARNLLLMSHIQENINDADIKTRILYNRSIAQFGLCAFRCGEYRHSLTSLAEFYPSNRIKELLAQGISRNYTDRNLEKEKEERRRQYPFHMHLNIDMIEGFHLISAMFEEVPNLAIIRTDSRRRIISKTFRHHFNHYIRQPFNGPPENTRDGVMAATVALQEADWNKSFRYLQELKIWQYIPHQEKVKNFIKNRLKEVALRTYLLSYAPQYSSIEMKTLKIMFELDDAFIHKVASEMIFTEQLQGAWDQTDSYIIMTSQPLSKLQRTALAFSEKAALFVDQNDRLMEQRIGYFSRTDGQNRTSFRRNANPFVPK